MKTGKKNLSQTLAALASGAVVAAAFAAPTAQAGAVVGGYVTSAQAAAAVDYANAIPMPLPQSTVPPINDSSDVSSQSLGVPGFVSGAVGNGKQTPVRLPVGNGPAVSADFDVSPQEFGTSNHPFTTKRVDLPASNTTTNSLANGVSLRWPYRIAGKLFFNIGTSTYVCSASLIKRGVIVTAAHCVANYGKKQFYTNWRFYPAYYNGLAPYGAWSVNGWWVMSSYYNGTDTCSTPGIVCANDVAVLTVTPTAAGAYPGTATGWYGYGWNGWGFNPSKQALFNQLGYPVALDGGKLMQRTDSQAFVSASSANNSVWGGLQTGGSSGGPELVNLGWNPVLAGTSFGAYANPNIVVGVTSWGYTSTAIKQQGASPFTSGNIVPLVTAACTPSTLARCN